MPISAPSSPSQLAELFSGARDRVPSPRLTEVGRPADLPGTSPDDRAALVKDAQRRAEGPWPFPRASQFARYWRDGVRTDYENDVHELDHRTASSVFAALATGDARWVDEAADGIMLLTELATWSWVAHDDCHDKRGWVVPDPDSPYLDLGAGETAGILAWADLALGAVLDERFPGLREWIRRQVRERVIGPYLNRHDWHWLQPPLHNWTGWIHQHLVECALFLLDRPEDRDARGQVLASAIPNLDAYLASFPDDGGIDEGYSYWWNGACRLYEAIELLEAGSGGAVSCDDPVLAELARFPGRMALGHGWYVNAADGPARPSESQPWHVLHRWGRRLGADDVIAQAAAYRREDLPLAWPNLGLGRGLMCLGDSEWCSIPPHSPAESQLPLPASVWLPRVQVAVAREHTGTADGLTLAAKGGHNGEAHNHLDVGSYMVATDGTPVLVDLGQPTYTAITFTERRYEVWPLTSAWHNVPAFVLPGGVDGNTWQVDGRQGLVASHAGHRTALEHDEIRPVATEPGATESGVTESGVTSPGAIEHSPNRQPTVEQGVGVVFAAREVTPIRPRPLPDGHLQTEGIEMDIAGAYPLPEGPWRYVRQVALRAGAVRIRDRWKLPEGTSVLLRHVLAGQILKHAPGRLLIQALNGTHAHLTWDAGLGEGELDRQEVTDPLLTASWGREVHRLTLTVPAGADSALVEVSSA